MMATDGDGSTSWGMGMMSSDKSPMLFVSHHSSKVGVAEHVERALNSKGVRCWIAPRDVDPGASFARAIPAAIGESSAVLLLFCSNSAKSRHVERELILADQLGKAIIPLRLERIDPGELSYHLAASQWIDWLEQRDEAIDRIAVKARDLQKQAHDGAPATGTVSIDELADQAPVALDKERAASVPVPPVSLDRPSTAFGGPPPPHGGTGGPGPGPGPEPHDHRPGERRGGGRLALWLALGGIALAVLAALAFFAMRSTTASLPITEDWMVGLWSDSRDCSNPIRFDANGDWVGPTGDRGTWSIEGGDTLIVEGANIDRQELRVERVSRDEIRGDDGSSYRCS